MTPIPPVAHLPRADVEDGLRWVDDWRAGEFTPAIAPGGWSVEMHGLASSYEELARSYLRALTALEHIRREPKHAEYVTFEFLGPRPSPETTASECADDRSSIVSAEGWEIRLRFPVEHEETAHAGFDQLLNHAAGLAHHGVASVWLQELVWVRAPHLLEGEEVRSIGLRYERL